MDGFRKLIAVDNHEAVKERGLHKDTKPLRVVKPKFTTDFPGAVIREGADELPLRAHGQTSNVGDQDGNLPWSTRIGMPFAMQFSRDVKDRSGKPCTTIIRTCTRPGRARREN